MREKGLFITLEGGDGTGKTTQIKRLVTTLRGPHGIPALATREVGGCPSAEEIRALWLSKPQGFWDPLSEVFLIMAARREHLVRTVWPAMEKGMVVISDRFIDSTRVYQGFGLGLGTEAIDALYARVAGSFWPNLTFYLDLHPSVGEQRMKDRAGPDDRYQLQAAAFHETVRSGFLELARREPTRIVVIDAAQSEEDVAKEISTRVLALCA